MATLVGALPDAVLAELVDICGEEHVLTGRAARFNRARVPAPTTGPPATRRPPTGSPTW